MASEKRPQKTALRPADDLEPCSFIGLNDIEEVTAQKIVQAITQRRLMPGTKLAEDELARIFEVSRERIRRILLVLSQHGILTIEHNRGAFVAVPTPRERHEAIALRKLLERHVIDSLCRFEPDVRNSICASLREHARAERAAGASRDREQQIQLSGDFHLKLAALTGNTLLLRVLRETVTRMSLALATQNPYLADLDCSVHEHDALIDAIEAGDSQRAMDLMDSHLGHVERNLQTPESTASALERAFNVAK